MTITTNTVVSIDYTLKDKDGQVIDTSVGSQPLEYVHGRGYLISGLEKELEGKSAGDSFSVAIPPAEAYGEYNKDLVIKVPKTQFDTDVEIEVGMQFEAGVPGGGSIVTVTEVSENDVTIDANPPLAGKELFFDVTVVSVREATEEDLAPKGGCGGCGGGCGGSCGDDCGCGGDCGCGN